MTNDLSRDVSNRWVGVVKTVEGGLDRGSILTKTPEGLLFAEEEMRAASAKGIDKREVVAAPRSENKISADQRGDKTNNVKLLWVEGLLANDEDTACDEDARLFRDAAHEGTYLVTFFVGDNVEHGLPGRIGNT